MDATLNNQSQEQQGGPIHQEASSEKSELMQVFEKQVSDVYWAYKDLLKAILENDGPENRA